MFLFGVIPASLRCHFYRAMLRRARCCYGKVVCPSVHLCPWRWGIV